MPNTLNTLTSEDVFSPQFVAFLDETLEQRERTDTREDLTTTHSLQAVRTFVDQILKKQESHTNAFGEGEVTQEALENILRNATHEERAVPLASAMREEPYHSAATLAIGLYEGLQAKEELSTDTSAPNLLSTLNQSQRHARETSPHETLHVAFDAFPEALRSYVREQDKTGSIALAEMSKPFQNNMSLAFERPHEADSHVAPATTSPEGGNEKDKEIE